MRRRGELSYRFCQGTIAVTQSGLAKVESIVAALRGHLIHCLVTDAETAELVLQYGGYEV